MPNRCPDVFVVIFARLPDKLYVGLRLDKRQVAEHALVHGACAERAANQQHRALARLQAERFHGFFFRTFGRM